jgi:hypothetical protein
MAAIKSSIEEAQAAMAVFKGCYDLHRKLRVVLDELAEIMQGLQVEET